MATNTFVEIDIPEAQYLADLTGIVNDLENAKRFAAQLKGMLSGNPPDYSLIEPMTIAILVSYCRPFASGIRHRLKENELASLSPEQRLAHENFRSWRDRHIAHSVNVFEENQPIARYWVERLENEGFTSVECNSNRLVGMSLQQVEMIIELATHFIEDLKPALMHEKQKVLEIVRSLPKDKVLGMAKTASVPKMEDVTKVRKQ